MNLTVPLAAIALALAGAAAHADAGKQAIAGMPKDTTVGKKPDSASAGASRPALQEGLQGGGFERLDLDGDGKVSKAEAAGHAALVKGFDRADRNRDGKLSLAEYDRMNKRAAARAKAKEKAKGRTASAQR